MGKRRILEKIKIDEISGVDAPAQSGAIVTIMKRRQPEPDTNHDFERTVESIQQRDHCSGTQALTKARAEAPKAYDVYRGDASATPSSDFDVLVRDEMRKGLSYEIAAQRVVLKHGARPDAAKVRKSANATAEFMEAVDAVMIAKRCSRTDAMSEVRRRDPELFSRYQEA